MKREEWFLFVCVIIAVMILMYGCAVTPAQHVATTQPVDHPFAAINAVIHHSQKVLEPINILAFIASLAGLALTVYGVFTADHPLERIGLLVATIAGVIALGTLAGIIALPFAPWVFMIGTGYGTGYGGYLIYKKYSVKKALTPPKPVV